MRFIKKDDKMSKTNTAQKNKSVESDEDRYPFDVKGIFTGIRNLSLSFQGSLFELIDNSLDHGKAEVVDVRLEWMSNDRLQRVAVVDDGIGMNKNQLFDALITGKSISYNQRDTIGRFGFGLKAGGLNQCRVIEVYSKVKNSDSHYAILNYDSFLEGKEKINAPIKKEIPEEFHDIIKDNGTVVIWKNLDIAERFNQKGDLEELRYHIGRTYRKFIGEEILIRGDDGKSQAVKSKNKKTIYVNNVKILPWDPLYYTKIPGFEKDSRSEIYYEDTITLPIHIGEELDSDEKKEDEIIIRFSILPKEWRKYKKQGGEDNPIVKQRWIHENEGISILRNGREVVNQSFYGITGKSETWDRWWGLEIEYPATLDRWFQIKNVKVGLEPNKILKEKLREKILSTKNRAVEIIRQYWDENEVKKRRDEKDSPSVSSHIPGEETFKEKGIGKPRIYEELTEEEKNEYFEKLQERFEDFDAKTDRKRFEELNIKFFDDYNMPEGSAFIDINPKLGVTELTYNLKHIFFRKINEIMEQQESLTKKLEEAELDDLSQELSETVNLMRYAIDLLIGSYASAHVSIDPYAKQEAKTTLMYLMSQWTTMLKIVTDDKDFRKRVHG